METQNQIETKQNYNSVNRYLLSGICMYVYEKVSSMSTYLTSFNTTVQYNYCIYYN